MQRLSGTDALMLSAETPAWHFHIGGLTVLEPEGSPVELLDNVAIELERRLPLAPKLTWKLRQVPLGLGRAVWVQDDDFDIGRHIRRARVSAPGGPHELAALAGRILSHQLDRRHPLWELWLIDGVCNDRAAMLMKSHHCLFDGVSGASLTTVLMDTEQHPKARPEPSGQEPEVGSTPSALSLLSSSIPYVASAPLRVGRYSLELARRALAAASFGRQNPLPFFTAPRTSFNARIGPSRAFGFSSVSLHDVRAVTNHFGVKVNDVVLALCAGALREYLAGNGEHYDSSLVASVPVSTRTPGSAPTIDGNQLAAMTVAIATDVADPAERLQRIHENTQSAKEMDHAIRVHEIQSLGETAPPVILSLAMRGIYESSVLGYFPTVANTVISNVPGPPTDLYCCGARIAGIYSSSVILETMGLNITAFSYGDRLDFGVHVDPGLVPDPFRVADNIPLALKELMHAAGLGEPRPVRDPFGITTSAR